jgi:uracil-DNA glycosylase
VAPPSPGTNGPSGTWLEQKILEPLELDREEVCLSDCLDTARLNAAQAARLDDTYAPVAERFGHPPCTLPPVPDGEAGIVREAREGHLDRLRGEMAACAPSTVVTLGNAALRVFALLADVGRTTPSTLTTEGYGQVVRARVDGREVTWLPLVHPRSGERTPRWRDAHARWVESAPSLP